MFEMNVCRICFVLLNLCIILEVNSLFVKNFNKNDFDKKSKLEFVHVISRHGNRSPKEPATGKVYDLSYWPDGWGQLTNMGKEQHFNLGKWFRSRYSDFLSPSYKSDEIYVQSSDDDHILMSAQANLAGLYIPTEKQIWNSNLLWQPIPVHTWAIDADYLIAGKVPHTCKSYQKALKQYKLSPAFIAKDQLTKSILDYVSAHVNATVTYKDMINIRDAWICESSHNLPIPEWSKPLLDHNETFYQALLALYYAPNETPYLAKYFTGFLLKDILNRLTSKVSETLVPDRKFWMYSTHGTAIVGFLHSLGILVDPKFPSYAASIIVELRSYEKENYVQILYKSLDEEPYVISIPGCGYACPLSKMYEIYDDIIPKQPFDVECQIGE